MSKKSWMYIALGLAAVGGYMWYKKNKKMSLKDIKKQYMIKKSWLPYIVVGGITVLLISIYRKKKLSESKVAITPSNVSKRKELKSSEVQFVGASGGKNYVKKNNLIPNTYGLYNKYENEMNASGTMGYGMSTVNIQEACKCADKNKPRETFLTNFR